MRRLGSHRRRRRRRRRPRPPPTHGRPRCPGAGDPPPATASDVPPDVEGAARPARPRRGLHPAARPARAGGPGGRPRERSLAVLDADDAGFARRAAGLLRQPRTAAARDVLATPCDPASLVRDGHAATPSWSTRSPCSSTGSTRCRCAPSTGSASTAIGRRASGRFLLSLGRPTRPWEQAHGIRHASRGSRVRSRSARGRGRARGLRRRHRRSTAASSSPVSRGDRWPTSRARSLELGRARSSSTPSPTPTSSAARRPARRDDPEALDGLSFPCRPAPTPRRSPRPASRSTPVSCRAAPASDRSRPAGAPRAHPRRRRRARRRAPVWLSEGLAEYVSSRPWRRRTGGAQPPGDPCRRVRRSPASCPTDAHVQRRPIRHCTTAVLVRLRVRRRDLRRAAAVGAAGRAPLERGRPELTAPERCCSINGRQLARKRGTAADARHLRRRVFEPTGATLPGRPPRQRRSDATQ